MKKPLSYLRSFLAIVLVSGLTACGGSSSTTIVLGGTVSGLTAGTVTLSNGASTVSIAANSTAFSFPSRIASNASYAITVQVQPTGLTCAVTNGSGVTGTTDISNVQVNCVPNNSLGGFITGLTAGGLVLANGSDLVSPVANATSFVFPTKVGRGYAYGVTVLTQPAGLTCTVQNGAGFMGVTDMSNVQVTCA